MSSRRPAARRPARPAPRSRYDGKPRVVAVVLAAVLVLALVGGAAGLGTGRDDEPQPLVQGSEVDAEGQELLDLLSAGRGGTFHASYTLAAPGNDIGYVLEVHRSEGRVREELIATSALGEEHRLTIFDRTTSASCAQPPGGLWTCTAVDAAQPQTDTIFGAITQASVIGRDVTVTDEVVDERDTRCFEYRTVGGLDSMCLTADGIPVRLSVAGFQAQLTALDAVVDAAVFLPPAPVT